MNLNLASWNTQTMKSLSKSPTLDKEKEEVGPEVWLSGYETIHLVDELLDPSKEEPNRRIGRSTKLALKHCLLALKHPHHPIVLRDHYNQDAAHQMLQRNMCRVFDALGIEYEIGMKKAYNHDPDRLTGVIAAQADCYYIIARPKDGIKI